MNKYIIWNCPAYSKDALDFCLAKNATQAVCYKCTDCVMKRIVEKCQKEISTDMYKANAYYAMGKVAVAEKILELLDIRECE